MKHFEIFIFYADLTTTICIMQVEWSKKIIFPIHIVFKNAFNWNKVSG